MRRLRTGRLLLSCQNRVTCINELTTIHWCSKLGLRYEINTNINRSEDLHDDGWRVSG